MVKGYTNYPFLTKRNLDNLWKLCRHLERLPTWYEHFNMATYHNQKIAEEQVKPHSQWPCGTVACAAGHSIDAGVPFNARFIEKQEDQEWGEPAFEYLAVDWASFAADAFMNDETLENKEAQRLYSWLFSGGWHSLDNTHRGAAARIRWVLYNLPLPGDPEGYYPAMDHGVVEAYQPYVVKGDSLLNHAKRFLAGLRR